MKLIVGLGNPGDKYKNTRHNLGFMVLDELVQNSKFKIQNDNLKFKVEKKFRAQICQFSKDTLLAKPVTFMNESGNAVSLICQFFKIKPEDVWIIHDDVDFPLGLLKIRFGGASAGHNGVLSIIEKLGTDKFWRFRIGIAPDVLISKISPRSSRARVDASRDEADGEAGKNQKQKTMEDYVLGEFDEQKKSVVQNMIKRGSDAVQLAIKEGMEKAMNRFNIK